VEGPRPRSGEVLRLAEQASQWDGMGTPCHSVKLRGVWTCAPPMLPHSQRARRGEREAASQLCRLIGGRGRKGWQGILEDWACKCGGAVANTAICQLGRGETLTHSVFQQEAQ
jgi:hypothetical protein